MIVPILVLLVLGLALIWLGGRRRAAVGLPPGKLVFVDHTKLGRVEKPLYDPATGLSGKPDYVVREGRSVIPVEVKSGRAPVQPYEAHVYQLAAYCLLVDVCYGVRPEYGILRYADRDFSVAYSEALENALLEVIAGMRRIRGRAPDRSHEFPNRCQGCGYRQVCDQRLTVE